jgi:hypothetical protein
MTELTSTSSWWLVWPALFIGYFILDLLNTKNVITITNLKPVPTANISLATTVLATIGTYICIKDSMWNMVPIGFGVWLGSYFALKWEIQILARKKMATKQGGVSSPKRKRAKTKRPGVIAKTRQSSNKASKHYKKPYVGQGK